jgi:hypothetical protein
MPELEDSRLAGRINVLHAEVLAAWPFGLEQAYEAGELLLQARQRCPRNTWTAWCREHLTAPTRAVGEYMRIARNWAALQAQAPRRVELTVRDALVLVSGLPQTPLRGATEPEPPRRRRSRPER